MYFIHYQPHPKILLCDINMKIFINNKVHVPKSLVKESTLDKFFSKRVYEESGCARCPFAPDRPVEDCNGCPNYLGTFKLWAKTRSSSGKSFVSLPPGNINRIKKLLNIDDSIKWVDKRQKYKFDYPVKFLWNLWDGNTINGRKTVNQLELIDKWEKAGRSGTIQAPPRSGKTATSISAMVKTGCKFVIITHESRLLKQFYDTIMGDEARNIQPATNLPRLEKKTGKKLCCIVENIKRDLVDNPDLQIALVTYQKFIKEGSAESRIKLLNKRFSGFIIDEAHVSSALAFVKFQSKLKMRYRLALSATPKRKDGLDWIGSQFHGPVVAEAIVTAMTPRIELVETGVSSGSYSYRSWVGMLKFLAKNKDRNKLIIREIFSDLRNGRKAIIIPVDHKNQGKDLVDAINNQARVNRDKRNEKWPEKTAVFYEAATKNKGYLEDLENGKIKVLVAIRNMIKQGIDMSRPDTLYMVIPMSADKTGNAGAPIFHQLSYRPCTFTETKTDPVLKLFVDNGVNFSTGCFKGLFWKEIAPGLKETKGKPPKYRMNDADFKRSIQIASGKAKTYNKPGERITSEEILDMQKDVPKYKR